MQLRNIKFMGLALGVGLLGLAQPEMASAHGGGWRLPPPPPLPGISINLPAPIGLPYAVPYPPRPPVSFRRAPPYQARHYRNGHGYYGRHHHHHHHDGHHGHGHWD